MHAQMEKVIQGQIQYFEKPSIPQLLVKMEHIVVLNQILT